MADGRKKNVKKAKKSEEAKLSSQLQKIGNLMNTRNKPTGSRGSDKS